MTATPVNAAPHIETEVAIRGIFDGIESGSIGSYVTVADVTGARMRTVAVRSPLETALSELHKLTLLAPNWDGYGAPGISAVAAMSALALLRQVQPMEAPPPSVVPSGDGSIYLEWRVHDRALTIEVLPTGEYRGIYESPAGEIEWNGRTDEGADPDMARGLRSLFRRTIHA